MLPHPHLNPLPEGEEITLPFKGRDRVGVGYEGGYSMAFPITRLRRMRATETHRRMVRETRLSADNLIYPLFVVHGRNVKREIGSMPGIFQLSTDNIIREAKEVSSLGMPAVILFGIPENKDETGSEAYADSGIVQQAVRAIK